VILYAACASAVVAALATWRRGGEPGLPPWAVARALWPYLGLAVLESLTLSASGHLWAEWLLPALATMPVVILSRSPAVIRRSRRGLLVAAVLLSIHGHVLLTQGYATRPPPTVTGKKLRAEWYTPLTGLRSVHR